MTVLEACIQVAPTFTFSRAARARGRTLYQPGSLTFLPGRSTVPLLIDHDDNQRIGTVRSLAQWEQPDGAWVYVTAEIEDAPSWLKIGTKASIGRKTITSQQVGDCDRVLRALLDEVSVLSPGIEPAESQARVVLLEPSRPAVRHHDRPGAVLVRPDLGQVLGVR